MRCALSTVGGMEVRLQPLAGCEYFTCLAMISALRNYDTRDLEPTILARDEATSYTLIVLGRFPRHARRGGILDMAGQVPSDRTGITLVRHVPSSFSRLVGGCSLGCSPFFVRGQPAARVRLRASATCCFRSAVKSPTTGPMLPYNFPLSLSRPFRPRVRLLRSFDLSLNPVL